MKDTSLLGSESNERIKNNESANNRTKNLFRPEVKSSQKQSGIELVSLHIVKRLVKSFAPSVSYSKAIRASRNFTDR